jgi:hypothetical protein
VATACAIIAHGQDAPVTPLAVETVGLPGVDEGVIADETHAPNTPESRRRSAIRASLREENRGSSGARYVSGRVIVKFRDGTSTTARVPAHGTRISTRNFSASKVVEARRKPSSPSRRRC